MTPLETVLQGHDLRDSIVVRNRDSDVYYYFVSDHSPCYLVEAKGSCLAIIDKMVAPDQCPGIILTVNQYLPDPNYERHGHLLQCPCRFSFPNEEQMVKFK